MGERLHAARISLCALAGFAAWSLLAVSWADSREDAWHDAARTVLYAAAFSAVVLLRWTPRSAEIVLGVVACGTSVLGLGVFIRASLDQHAGWGFPEGRLSPPTGYPNATCALFMMAFWAALILATRRTVPAAARVALLAAAGVLMQLAVLSQSRALLIAGPVTFGLALAAVRDWLRLVIFTAAVVSTAAVSLGPVLDIYGQASPDGALQAAVEDARNAVVLSAVLLVVGGALLVAADSRARVPVRFAQQIARGALAVLVVIMIGGLVAATAQGNLRTRVANRWDEFRTDASGSSDSHLLSGPGSSRYAIWRSVLHDFSSSPLIGVGPGNASTYLGAQYATSARGRHPPHSLELKVAAETGIVGTLFLAAFFVAVLVAAVRALGRGPPEARGVTAAAGAAAAYYLLHGSVDRFYESVVLSVPAFVLCAIVVRMGTNNQFENQG